MRPHIVQVSSGVASWYCAKLVIDRYGPDQVLGLFADVPATAANGGKAKIPTTTGSSTNPQKRSASSSSPSATAAACGVSPQTRT